ncbi:MAG: hypothetical protein H0U67_02570 [Gemmatimonadetes bacterium]|nr:hypothetical protein [Gemmatimonadota bacterium]
MAKYLITYDLKKTKDYPRLWNALGQLGACRALLSVWLLRSNSSAVQIRDHLRSFIDADDKLLVAAMTGESAALNLSQAEVTCLKS